MSLLPKICALLACTAPVACEGSSCRQMSRTLVTDPNAPLYAGGTLADLQTTVGGTRSGPLYWHESAQYVRGFPPSGQTEITVTVAEPDHVWDMDFERHNTARNERLYCGDYLETELDIELRSDDMVLDARFHVPVVLDGTSGMTIYIDVTDDDLGNLPWDPIEPDAELALVLSYGSLTGPEGALRYSYERSDDSGNGIGFMTDLATFTLPDLAPERTVPN
jgi:hypothetical protein